MSEKVGSTSKAKSNTAPKRKGGPSVPRNVGNKEHYQRMNYLLQASSFLSRQISASGFDADPNVTDEALSRGYLRNMDLIRKKNQLGLSPHVKRQVCKKCLRWLIPGHNMTMRIDNRSKLGRLGNKKADILVFRCVCGTEKRFPIGTDPAYQLYLERPEKLVSILDE